MKRYNKNFEYTPEFIKKCIYLCLKTRWKRRDTSYFFAEYAIKFGYSETNNIHNVAREIYKIEKQDRKQLFSLVDEISDDMYYDINNKDISLKPIKYQERFDKSSGKLRKIGISTIKQQVFDYIAVESCKNMFLSKICYYQCASLKDKGQLFGKTALEKWVRTNPKKTRYVFKCDIKKCYPSINNRILKRLLARDLKNDDCLYLLYTLIDTYGEKGLCIGSYLSQYLANYYLSYAFHYLSENCYKMRKNRKTGELKRVNLITRVLFYMDDMVIFGSRKADLKIASKMLEKYLIEELDLYIKDNYQFFSMDNNFIDMMEYKVYKDHTTIRNRTFLKARRKYIKYKDKSKPITLKDARTITSYYGYFKHSDSIKVRKKYKIDEIFERAKGVVSEHDNSRIYRETAAV